MRAHYLQHVPFEDTGCIGPLLKEAGYSLTHTRFFETTALPDPDDVDFLVIMGGPMSVNDVDAFPWLVDEKAFIRRCVDSGKPVLGICLGAQLMAAAMGGRVSPVREKEIGWYPVTAVGAEREDVFGFPARLNVFHWHGESFELPAGAVHLARSEACEHQAFQLGASAIGLQFHLEMTPESVKRIIAHCRHELTSAPWIQNETDMLSVSGERYAEANGVMGDILAYLAAHCGQ